MPAPLPAPVVTTGATGMVGAATAAQLACADKAATLLGIDVADTIGGAR
jgi:hypothetical protein